MCIKIRIPKIISVHTTPNQAGAANASMRSGFMAAPFLGVADLCRSATLHVMHSFLSHTSVGHAREPEFFHRRCTTMDDHSVYRRAWSFICGYSPAVAMSTVPPSPPNKNGAGNGGLRFGFIVASGSAVPDLGRSAT